MSAQYPAITWIGVAVLALTLFSSSGIISVNVSSQNPVSINSVVEPGAFITIPIQLNAGETVKVDVDVTSGPDVRFYFLDQVGLSEFDSAWPTNISSFSAYLPELSSAKSDSIHKSAPAPVDGLFHLVIANDNPATRSSVVGSISAASNFPTGPLIGVIIVIVVIVAVIVVVAFVATRSVKAKAQQYVPPGQPTPQGQTHQHMTGPRRPVVQQSIGRICPKCGAPISGGASTCPKCGTRL